jgi:hypothetical protein
MYCCHRTIALACGPNRVTATIGDREAAAYERARQTGRSFRDLAARYAVLTAEGVKQVARGGRFKVSVYGARAL